MYRSHLYLTWLCVFLEIIFDATISRYRQSHPFSHRVPCWTVASHNETRKQVIKIDDHILHKLKTQQKKSLIINYIINFELKDIVVLAHSRDQEQVAGIYDACWSSLKTSSNRATYCKRPKQWNISLGWSALREKTALIACTVHIFTMERHSHARQNIPHKIKC